MLVCVSAMQKESSEFAGQHLSSEPPVEGVQTGQSRITKSGIHLPDNISTLDVSLDTVSITTSTFVPTGKPSARHQLSPSAMGEITILPERKISGDATAASFGSQGTAVGSSVRDRCLSARPSGQADRRLSGSTAASYSSINSDRTHTPASGSILRTVMRKPLD